MEGIITAAEKGIAMTDMSLPPNQNANPNPTDFALTSFADLLPKRIHVIGEDPGAFELFRSTLLAALAPMTAHECVVAENLVNIEWDILQHRKMAQAQIYSLISSEIQCAYYSWTFNIFEAEMERLWQEFRAAGKSEDDWKDPYEFDKDMAKTNSQDLVERAISSDLEVRKEAHEELKTIGLNPVYLMSEAHFNALKSIQHFEYIERLEKRRRFVKKDYDRLQELRPIEAILVSDVTGQGLGDV